MDIIKESVIFVLPALPVIVLWGYTCYRIYSRPPPEKIINGKT